MDIELGGFAEYETDIDDNFELYNYNLALEYVDALYNEEFNRVGEIDEDFFNNICYWLNYKEELRNEDLVENIKKAQLETKNKRTLIDAIYDKKIICLAEIYLKKHIYSPKLILTLLQNDDYDSIIYIDSNNPDDFTQIINDLYKQIEIEFEKQENKKEYAYMIKNSFKKIIIPKSIKNSHISSNYNWIKVLK